MGPLGGIRVLEIAGIGPGPHCATLLSDLGAEVLRVDRLQAVPEKAADRDAPHWDLLARGRRSVGVDLKHPDAAALVLRLVERADVLIEGFRPGVAERLGIGPVECLGRNPALIYGRMTGWGQSGPLAHAPGHDINYIALAGALYPIGDPDQPPVPPLNFVGDFGGGSMFLALGIASALFERERSGQGQVVDAAMVDGAAHLTTLFQGLRNAGMWSEERGVNLIDGAAPFYGVYETRDGQYVSLGNVEEQFHRRALELMGLDERELPPQSDRRSWDQMKQRFRDLIRQKTRDEWCELMEGEEVCFAPVLPLSEVATHPHNAARGVIVELDGVPQPAPAPRFSRTPGSIQGPPAGPGQHTATALADWGIDDAEIARLRDAKAIR
jgi:alpha-methylacyl-CoA racemase